MTAARSIPAILRKRIREIDPPQAVEVGPQASVYAAVAVMRRRNVSCILVTEGGKPQGIFTERNLVRLASQGMELKRLRMEEVMTSPVLTCGEREYVYKAFGTMLTSSIRHLVVVDDKGEVLGVVTLSNIIAVAGYEHFLELKRNRQVMSRELFTLPAEASVHEVLGLMARKEISCVIITRGGKAAGIITERDAAGLLTNGWDAGRHAVGEVMSAPLISVAQEHTVQDSARIMRLNGVRRLVVVDEEGDPVGIITQSDIILGLESKYIEVYKELIRLKDQELRATLSALEEKNLLLDGILTSSIDMGIVAMDTGFRITYSNPVAGEILGLAGDLVGRDLMDVQLLEPHISARKPLVQEGAVPRSTAPFTFERESGDRGRRSLQGRLSGIYDKQQQLIGYVLMLSDMTERKLAEETIRFIAYHDILTGLPNRVLLNERLYMELARAERHSSRFALMLIDLDRFKDVNDTLGHYAGDLLLKALSRRLKQLLRKSDTVARIGGDEFVIILSEVQNPENVLATARRILCELERGVSIEGREVKVTASLGIALYPDHGADADTLLRVADSAMYRAKELHRTSTGSNLFVAERS